MIEDWVQEHVDSDIKYTGNEREIHFDCPLCNDTRKRMYINLVTGLVHCHNCNFSSNIVGLIQVIEGISFTKAIDKYSNIAGNSWLPSIEIDDHVTSKLMSAYMNPEKRAIPLPDEYVELTKSRNIVAKRAIKYLHSRRISNKQISQHKMGICVSGEYKNRIIIPIFEGNELKFWVARAIGDKAYLKEKSPANESYQISKSEVIFNIDKAAKEYRSIVISEGIFDALSWGGIGVSLLGKELYDEQMNTLLNYRMLLTDGVFIALDFDARSQAIDMAKRLSTFFNVKLVNIPKKYDDPNKYRKHHSRSEMWKLINEAEEYNEFYELNKLLIS